MSAATTRQHREDTRIVLRPIGSGLPVGLFALAIGSLLAGCLSLGLIPAPESPLVGLMLMTFAAPLELIAAVAAFWARDTMSATVYGIFGASWLALGSALYMSPPGATSITAGVFVLIVAASILLLALVAFKTKPYIGVLLLCSVVRLAAYGLYEVQAGVWWNTVSGSAALVVVVLGLYGAVAFSLEDAKQREVLPLFRKGPADTAFRGYEQQLDRLEAEPGIRQQL